jgi:GNAT superfamily N-acetyltransferase
MMPRMVTAIPSRLEDIQPWRDLYRQEMPRQILWDSIHYRPGWTQEYALLVSGTTVGYGSVARAGPWTQRPTIYEFHVVPPHRVLAFDLFQALVSASGVDHITVQTNAPQLTAMLHTFARDVTVQSILFADGLTTSHAPPGAVFRTARAGEIEGATPEQLPWAGVVEVDGQIAASGGILLHYNRPYGDIYMETREPFRRRGLGAFIVQELKRVAYEGGHIPAARTGNDNVASRRTLQKAGFVPCGHILHGTLGGER